MMRDKLKLPTYLYRFEIVKIINKTLESGKEICTILRGNSMEPCAFDGDKITVRPIKDYKEIKKNMIIAISKNERHFVVHRVLEINNNNNTLFEKGDNSECGSWIDVCYAKGIIYRINDKLIT